MFLHYSQITFKHRHTIYVVNVASKKTNYYVPGKYYSRKDISKNVWHGTAAFKGRLQMPKCCILWLFFLVFPFTPLHTIPSLPTLFSLPLPIPLPLHPTSHFSSFLQRIIISHFFQRYEMLGLSHQDRVVMNDRCVILPWPRRVDASQ